MFYRVKVFVPSRNCTETHLGISHDRLIEGLHNGGLSIYVGDRCPIISYQEHDIDGLWTDDDNPVVHNHRLLKGIDSDSDFSN